MKEIKNQINIIKLNFKTLVIFELLFKLLTSLIFLPMAIKGMSLAMKINGYSYLTLENIFNFLFTPITICFSMVVIVFLTIVTLFDYSTILIIYDASFHNKKIGLFTALMHSLKRCKRLVKPQNILVSLILLVLIPLLNIGISSNVITTIKIPEFIMDFIESNMMLSILFALGYLILAVLFMKWLYTIHYMILDDKDFISAIKASANLSKNNKIKDLIKIVISQIIIYLIYILAILIGIFIIYMFHKFLSYFKIIESIYITIIWLFLLLTMIIFSVSSSSISYLIITSFYYKHKLQKNQTIKEINYKIKKKERKLKKSFKYIIMAVVITIIMAGSVLTYQILIGDANLNIEYTRNMEITAHRGASTMRPENTMAAFKMAKKLKADFIELDVQQTKDRYLVVSHDTNLLRTSGVDKDIIESNYAEISTLDVGSYFDNKYKDEVLPLLDNVIKYGKENNIRLNIELKPTGREVEFEKQVVDLVNEYNFSKGCVITSQTYSVLKKIKEYDPSIKTIYVMSIAIGDVTKLKYADGFSLEASNVNSYMVSKIHNSGKEVYAWTVNTEDSIKQMIDMGVDNIITDDITLAREVLIKSKQSNVIEEIIKTISSI